MRAKLAVSKLTATFGYSHICRLPTVIKKQIALLSKSRLKHGARRLTVKLKHARIALPGVQNLSLIQLPSCECGFDLLLEHLLDFLLPLVSGIKNLSTLKSHIEYSVA